MSATSQQNSSIIRGNQPGNGGVWAPGGGVATSWFDLVTMTPKDPRLLVSTINFEAQGGGFELGTFAHSSSWLNAGPWVNAPLGVSQGALSTVLCPNPQDFASVNTANVWNATQQMTVPSNLYPLAVQKIMFLKAGTAFINQIYLDWSVGVTSTNVQFSFRDNSTTSGDFQNAAAGTIPVFAFPTGATYGGLARNLQVTLLRPGRYNVCLRIIDNSGNYSMFEMMWIVLP